MIQLPDTLLPEVPEEIVDLLAYGMEDPSKILKGAGFDDDTAVILVEDESLSNRVAVRRQQLELSGEMTDKRILELLNSTLQHIMQRQKTGELKEVSVKVLAALLTHRAATAKNSQQGVSVKVNNKIVILDPREKGVTIEGTAVQVESINSDLTGLLPDETF